VNEPEHPLRSIFGEALGIADVEERSAFLDRVCGPHSVLRREVEELLLAQAQAGNFLPDKPATTKSRAAVERLVEAANPAGTSRVATTIEKPGDRIGRYELLEKIGEGGCGVVYLAWQETPVRRQVALKVIKLGMDTKQVIARFEAERQALAIMDHPNIAKVFDAGVVGWDQGAEVSGQRSEVGRSQVPAPGDQNSEAPVSDPGPSPTSAPRLLTIRSGRPYFVMEFVRGSKITDYCNREQLSTHRRLELFIQVCQAVQHAHQKGVIHRDLKPSNILVTTNDGVPVPKVIDFGIAKATEGKLTDQTLFTAFEQFLGTPAYMSPEQAAMTTLDVDTRSDIYSLGVLLYELLTGSTPFDTKELLTLGVDELRRTIREKEPVRPSTRLTQELLAADVEKRRSASEVRDPKSEPGESSRRHPATAKELIHQLRGDLDWIVMKCLEKDRARRYETANGLAMDLARHLNNEPVVARPPSRLYEFQKTVRRHKTGFAATAAVILALVAGTSSVVGRRPGQLGQSENKLDSDSRRRPSRTRQT
jgi:serine/threonine protein kinase